MSTNQSDRVANHFTQEWEDYDHQIRESIPFYDQALATLLRVVREGVAVPDRILDLGVGTGNLAHLLLGAFPDAHLTGVDLVPNYIELAARRLAAYREHVSLLRADLIEFDLEPSRYDLIVTSFAFHHISDQNKRLLYARISESLSRGGCFVNADFVDSASPSWRAAFDRIRIDHMRESGWSEEQIKRRYVDHRNLEIPVPMEAQLEWLQEAGLVDVECFWKYLNLAVFGGRRP